MSTTITPSDEREKIDPKLMQALVQRAGSVLRQVDIPFPRSSRPRAMSGLGGSIIDMQVGRLNQVDPLVPWRYLPLLQTLAVAHPEVSQTVKLLVANANTSHEIVVESPSGQDEAVAAANVLINDLAERVWNGGDVDAMLNADLWQLAVTGALSAEDVIDPGARRVAMRVQVPVEDIRFVLGDDGAWRPVQQPGGSSFRMRELDERTYRYTAWQTTGNNPYAIPPFAAALDQVVQQHEVDDQWKRIATKIGLLGILRLAVKRPTEGLEMTDMHDRMVAESEYLEEVYRTVSSQWDPSKGMSIGWQDDSFDFTAAPTTQAQGMEVFTRLTEQRLISGLGIDPALLGRAWAKTETWLGVARGLMEQYASVFQRLAGARYARTINLELALQCAPVFARVDFEEVVGMRPLERSQAEWQQWQMSLNMLSSGAIDEDTAARRHGLERWHDPDRIPKSAGSGFDLRSLWTVVDDMVTKGALSPDAGADRLGLTEWHDPSRIPDPTAMSFGGFGGPGAFQARSAGESVTVREWLASAASEIARRGAAASPSRPRPSKAGEQAPATTTRSVRLRWTGHRYVAQRERVSSPSLEAMPAGASPEERARETLARRDARQARAAARVRRDDGDAVEEGDGGGRSPVVHVPRKYVATAADQARLRDLVRRYLGRYAARVEPIAGELQYLMLEDLKAAIRNGAPSDDPQEFARWALNELQGSFRKHWRRFGGEQWVAEVADVQAEGYEAWRTEDRTIWAGRNLPDAAKVLGKADTAAIRALTQQDAWHVSVYLDNLSGRERQALEDAIATEVVTAGRDLGDPDVLDDLLAALERGEHGELLLRRRDHGREGGFGSESEAEALERMGYRIQRIAATTAMRSRNTSALYGMQAAEVDHAIFVARRDSRTSDICADADGAIISVASAAERTAAFHALSPEEQEAVLLVPTSEEVQAMRLLGRTEELVPPLHPNCRSRLEVYFGV